MVTIGLIAPGAMGAEVGACARASGTEVLWASDNRSAQTRDRAEGADLTDVGQLSELCRRVDVMLSVCPPHAALAVAEDVAGQGFDGIYVDANAIAPDTAREIARIVEPRAQFVDGGLVGPPPTRPDTTRLYLAGEHAAAVAALFADGRLDARVLSQPVPAASALKVAYAAWTKGSSALLLTVCALASSEGVHDDLLTEWGLSRPELVARAETTWDRVAPKAWRWIGEMHEIAQACVAAGLPDGFHHAAAEIYEQLSHAQDEAGPRDPDAGSAPSRLQQLTTQPTD